MVSSKSRTGHDPQDDLGIEIVRDLALSAAQARLLEMHSIYNVLNALVFRIDALGHLVGESDAADQLMDELIAWHGELADRNTTIQHLRRVPQLRARLEEWLAELPEPAVATERVEFEFQRDNLLSICDVLATRAEELLQRSRDALSLERRSLDEIRSRLVDALRAIEKNALGAWAITFDGGPRPDRCYRIEIVLESVDGHSITLPAVLEDVLRDLTANARKFTEPGGEVRASLVEEPDRIRLRVEDSGRGILPEELESVIAFGVRASNQGSKVRTGGGFGLTKAYHATRRLGGRFWIRSRPGQGTAVTIEVPRPAASPTGADRSGE